MNGAPNTLNVALSQISNLAVIIKQSPPRSPLRTQEQHISENPDWIAQVRSIEKAVGAYSPRLLYVSERSMLNMAHLAVQEIWRQTVWIHFHQALFERGPFFPAIKTAV